VVPAPVLAPGGQRSTEAQSDLGKEAPGAGTTLYVVISKLRRKAGANRRQRKGSQAAAQGHQMATSYPAANATASAIQIANETPATTTNALRDTVGSARGMHIHE
jgi:hypothetical protein